MWKESKCVNGVRAFFGPVAFEALLKNHPGPCLVCLRPERRRAG